MTPLIVLGIICQILLYSMACMVLFAIFKILRRSIHPNIPDKLKQGKKITRFWLLGVYNDPINLITLSITLIYIIVLITIKIGFDFQGKAGDIPGLYFTGVPLVLVMILLIENGVKYIRTKKMDFPDIIGNSSIVEKNETLELRKKVDLKRKLWHFIIFFIALILLVSGWFIVQAHAFKYEDLIDKYEVFLDYWGNMEGSAYLPLIFEKHSLPAGQTISIFMFYTAAVIFLVIDLSRLSENLQFFLQKNAYRHIWNKEHYTIAAYTHFTIAYLAVAMTVPPLMFLAILCLGCFADPAASLIGMNWGKHPIATKNKTWEGLIAGSFAAFISMIWFVGPIYAIFGTLIFIITDLLSPKPIRISDNLSMPLLTMICFVLLSFLNITAFNLLGL